MANLVGMPESADMSRYDYLRGNLAMTILALGSVYLVSSFAEEVIYRGFLITRITALVGSGKWSCFFAVLASSLVFGLVHSDWGVCGNGASKLHGLGPGYVVLRRQTQLVAIDSGSCLHGHDSDCADVLRTGVKGESNA